MKSFLSQTYQIDSLIAVACVTTPETHFNSDQRQ
uniref:Uncharacterized protein n=1 Tax=Anguilla anguilla TaxID=7936 RepID=A0A0E9WBG4_ANGAN